MSAKSPPVPDPIEVGPPNISVVVPTRNRADLLRRTLTSVFDQTGTFSFEIIVVEQESTDATAAVLAEFNDPRLRIIRAAPIGPAAARNLAIEAAHGQWVAFVDDDDYWAPNKLQLHVEALEDAEADWGGTGTLYIDGNGRLIGERPPPRVGRFDSILADILEQNVITSTSTVIAKRSLLREAGGFSPDIHFGEDWLFWIELARRGVTLQLAECLTATRIAGGSATANLEAVTQLFDRLDEVRGSAPDSATNRERRAHREITMCVSNLRAGHRFAGAAHRLRAAWIRRNVRDVGVAGYIAVVGPSGSLRRAYRTSRTAPPAWLR